MNDTNDIYNSFVLFGIEQPSSIYDEQILIPVLNEMKPWLDPRGKTKITGLIYGPRPYNTNLAPRKGKMTDENIARWVKVINTPGNVCMSIMCSDIDKPELTKQSFSDISKYWAYDGDLGYTDSQSKTGYGNSLSLAIKLQGNDASTDEFVSTFEKVAILTNTIYGFVETQTPWSVPMKVEFPEDIGLQTHFLSLRYRDVAGDYYGVHSMTNYASRLHQHMIINDGQKTGHIPGHFVSCVKPISPSVSLYSFVKDPHTDSSFYEELRQYLPPVPPRHS